MYRLKILSCPRPAYLNLPLRRLGVSHTGPHATTSREILRDLKIKYHSNNKFDQYDYILELSNQSQINIHKPGINVRPSNNTHIHYKSQPWPSQFDPVRHEFASIKMLLNRYFVQFQYCDAISRKPSIHWQLDRWRFDFVVFLFVFVCLFVLWTACGAV